MARNVILRLRLPTASILVVLLALLGIWTELAVELREQYRRDTIAAEQESGNLARGFGENVNRMIESVDQIMLLLRAAYAANPDPAELSRWAAADAFRRALTLQVTFVDRAGVVTGSNLGPVTTRVDLSDREHIRAQIDSAQDRLFISKPALGRISGKWSIQFTRKLFDRDGSFAGVIVVSLDPYYLARFYESIEIGRGAVVLVGLDGVVRARAPVAEGTIGALYDPAAMARIAGGPPIALLEPAAGGDLIRTYRRLGAYPLAVVVELAPEDVFAAFYRSRELYFLAAIGLTALVLTGGGAAGFPAPAAAALARGAHSDA